MFDRFPAVPSSSIPSDDLAVILGLSPIEQLAFSQREPGSVPPALHSGVCVRKYPTGVAIQVQQLPAKGRNEGGRTRHTAPPERRKGRVQFASPMATYRGRSNRLGLVKHDSVQGSEEEPEMTGKTGPVAMPARAHESATLAPLRKAVNEASSEDRVPLFPPPREKKRDIPHPSHTTLDDVDTASHLIPAPLRVRRRRILAGDPEPHDEGKCVPENRVDKHRRLAPLPSLQTRQKPQSILKCAEKRLAYSDAGLSSSMNERNAEDEIMKTSSSFKERSRSSVSFCPLTDLAKENSSTMNGDQGDDPAGGLVFGVQGSPVSDSSYSQDHGEIEEDATKSRGKQPVKDRRLTARSGQTGEFTGSEHRLRQPNQASEWVQRDTQIFSRTGSHPNHHRFSLPPLPATVQPSPSRAMMDEQYPRLDARHVSGRSSQAQPQRNHSHSVRTNLCAYDEPDCASFHSHFSRESGHSVSVMTDRHGSLQRRGGSNGQPRVPNTEPVRAMSPCHARQMSSSSGLPLSPMYRRPFSHHPHPMHPMMGQMRPRPSSPLRVSRPLTYPSSLNLPESISTDSHHGRVGGPIGPSTPSLGRLASRSSRRTVSPAQSVSSARSNAPALPLKRNVSKSQRYEKKKVEQKVAALTAPVAPPVPYMTPESLALLAEQEKRLKEKIKRASIASDGSLGLSMYRSDSNSQAKGNSKPSTENHLSTSSQGTRPSGSGGSSARTSGSAVRSASTSTPATSSGGGDFTIASGNDMENGKGKGKGKDTDQVQQVQFMGNGPVPRRWLSKDGGKMGEWLLTKEKLARLQSEKKKAQHEKNQMAQETGKVEDEEGEPEPMGCCGRFF